MINDQIIYMILIVNSLAAICYFIWGVLFVPHIKWIKPKRGGVYYLIKSFIFLLCPIIGILFFIISDILHLLMFFSKVDLSDVLFSKERVTVQPKGELERELNFSPLEEAIIVNDERNLRQLMMNILRGDVSKSLSTISLALNSQDTETSHYAATALRDELNSFREQTYRLYNEITDSKRNQISLCQSELELMYPVLNQEVFTKIEQENYIHIFDEVCEILFSKSKKQMIEKYYSWVSDLCLSAGLYERSETWCVRAKRYYPNSLLPYKCLLKLYYQQKDQDKFLKTMDELKASNVVIDNDTLEIIRIFS